MKTFMRTEPYFWFFYFVIAFRQCTYWLLCTFTEFSKHGYKLILGETLYLSQHVLSLSQGVLSLSLYIYQARIQAVRGEKHFLQRQLVEPQSLASLRELLLWRDWKDGCSLWRGTCSSRRRWGRSTPWWLMTMMMIGDHFEDFEEKMDFEEMLFQPCTSTGATLASRWTDLTLWVLIQSGSM